MADKEINQRAFDSVNDVRTEDGSHEEVARLFSQEFERAACQ